MIPITPWILTSYTVATWTDLIPAVTAPTVIKTVSIAVGSNPANVQIQVVLSGGASVLIVPTSSLLQTTGYSIDIGAFTLGIGDSLQIQVDVAGVQFAAFGAQ
jgi:hypothetical protein